jgi:RNA polymerase sigma-70 factor (ECF subfamily)
MYDAHHKQVLAYCLRRSPGEGRDVAADTFAVAWQRIDAAPDDGGALPWLYTIARKVLANNHRSRASAKRLKARIGGVDRLRPVEPDIQVVRRWEEQRVVKAVNRLRPNDRQVLLLVTWEELSHAQIAGMLGISVAAVGQRIHRAKKRLRRQLKKSTATVPAGPHAIEKESTA